MLETCPKHNVIRVQSATQWTASGGVGWVGGVGWGGVGMMTFFELEHMVDATQLCLSCHCTHGGCYATVRWGGVGWGGDDDILWTWTHGGCYATVLVLSLHTWWMLRNCAVGWGGVGWGWWHSLNLNTWWMLRNCACLHSLNLNTWWMLRNCACLIIAHMVDATQLCGGVGWGGVGMMTFFELEHMVDATQLCLSCHCTHGGCYATVLGLSLHTWWMLRNCACLVIAHMVDATQLCLSCHCTHGGCYATVLFLSLHTWWMLRNSHEVVSGHVWLATSLQEDRSLGHVAVTFIECAAAAFLGLELSGLPDNMERHFYALTLLILILLAGQSLPPFLQQWSGYTLNYLDHLHEVGSATYWINWMRRRRELQTEQWVVYLQMPQNISIYLRIPLYIAVYLHISLYISLF